MKFLDRKTEGGKIRGKLSLYCTVLGVSRQGFYYYLKHKDDPWKYEDIAEKMRAIVAEDECNDTYGRSRMYDALNKSTLRMTFLAREPFTGSCRKSG